MEKGMLLYGDLNCKHVTWVVLPALGQSLRIN